MTTAVLLPPTSATTTLLEDERDDFYRAQDRVYESIYAPTTTAPWTLDKLPNLARHFLRLVQASGGSTVLDLCAGNAVATIGLAQRAPGLSFIAVEKNASPVAQARRLVAEAGLVGQVQVVQADAFKLSQHFELDRAVGTADVFERYGLTTHARAQDRRDYWEQLRSIIRPRGYFFVTAFSILDADFYGARPADYPAGEVRFPADHYYHPLVFQKFFGLDELARDLRRAGFEVVGAVNARHPRVPESRFVCEIIARKLS
jgi:cyclopropane fatty-acyl-phospholipid synthase-like methyltransferase